MDRNDIHDQGVTYLVEALQGNKQLTHLSLSYNAIGEDGAKILAQVIKRDSALQSLSLEGNSIGANGAQSIASSLPMNASLEDLNVKGNGVGEQGKQVICDALLYNHSLTTVLVKDRTTRRRDTLIDTIEARLERNRTTRNVLKEPNFPVGVWPELIAKLDKQQQPDQLLFLLSQKIDLFQAVK